MVLDAVRQHYVAVLGEPSRRASYKIDSYPAEVFKWDAAANPHGVGFYASIGASRDPLSGLYPSHRVEFFVGFLPEQDGVARPLAMVALDPVLHGSALGPGQTVTYPEPLWLGTEMCSFLILRPQVQIVPDLVFSDGVHVEFLQLVPIFASELEFKVAHGADALMAELEQACVPFWDPNRAPLAISR
jgi:hypothetical protein